MMVDFYHTVEFYVVAMFGGLKTNMHYKKIAIWGYNEHFHKRPLVTHFMERFSKSFQ